MPFSYVYTPRKIFDCESRQEGHLLVLPILPSLLDQNPSTSSEQVVLEPFRKVLLQLEYMKSHKGDTASYFIRNRFCIRTSLGAGHMTTIVDRCVDAETSVLRADSLLQEIPLPSLKKKCYGGPFVVLILPLTLVHVVLTKHTSCFGALLNFGFALSRSCLIR